jgi:prefoldin beta subunit
MEEDCKCKKGEECLEENCKCEEDNCGHGGNTGSLEEAPVNSGNPFGNLDSETQQQIQELQMMEQGFQQLMKQKSILSMDSNEVELVVSEVEKTDDDVYRIVGNQVVIKSSKENILEDMKNKKELIEKRLEEVNNHEKEFSEKMEAIRDEVMKKIQG